jgi:uncharacterized protein YjbI with pentapeptide repeats
MTFERPRLIGGQTRFADAEFSGGDICFGGAELSGGDVSFRGSEFSGAHFSFYGAKFSGAIPASRMRSSRVARLTSSASPNGPCGLGSASLLMTHRLP